MEQELERDELNINLDREEPELVDNNEAWRVLNNLEQDGTGDEGPLAQRVP